MKIIKKEQSQFYLNGINCTHFLVGRLVHHDIEKKNIKGVIQIIHGMSEHLGRYEKFISHFEDLGFIVTGIDHYNHGRRVSNYDNIGLVYKDLDQLLNEQILLTKFLKEKYEDLPFYVLGHSMGSFITMGHMKSMSLYVSGYVFTGSALIPSWKSKAGYKMFKFFEVAFNNKRNKFLNKLFFTGVNIRVKKPKTDSDWLSRVEENVKDHVYDPLCKFTYVPSFYTNILKYLKKLYNPKDFSSVRKTLPLYILSGDMDPIGKYGRYTSSLNTFFSNLGFTTKYSLVPGGRHEILNDIGRDKIYEDLLDFFTPKKLEK